MTTNTTERSVNHAHLAAAAVTDLMVQLTYLRYGLRVPVGQLVDPTFNPNDRAYYSLDAKEGEHYNHAFLIGKTIEAIQGKGGTRDTLALFGQFVGEAIKDDYINKRVQLELTRIDDSAAYKKEWEANFNRDTEERALLLDPLVPQGHVHYRYVYTYCRQHGGYRSSRELVSAHCESYWQQHPYWFDYWGPPEDDRGLIWYLDYE
ncbi:hypothetical protein [Aliagarivorans taiwanensis]|uniref:hypothetical protein n=1 Tax=Aliagarivorans taiwanensis TaxID=561966 RepID=UPI0004123460|nr:hypothetical protein [Aliagarivorans taiwanensis]